jgi:hypothetical protein
MAKRAFAFPVGEMVGRDEMLGGRRRPESTIGLSSAAKRRAAARWLPGACGSGRDARVTDRFRRLTFDAIRSYADGRGETARTR